MKSLEEFNKDHRERMLNEPHANGIACPVCRKELCMNKSFNPHWLNDEHCRDYKIGNIILTDIPDSFVMRVTEFRGPYGFAEGQMKEFMEKTKLTIPYNQSIQPAGTSESSE